MLEGSGRVGLSWGATRAALVAGFMAGEGGAESELELVSEEFSWSWSTCIAVAGVAAPSSSSSTSSARLRAWGRSCAGVDLGRGGVSVTAIRDRDLPGASAMGLRMLPECDWRRRRVGIVVRSPDMVLVVVVGVVAGGLVGWRTPEETPVSQSQVI